MPVNLGTEAKNRAAEAIVQPIKTTTGILELLQGSTIIVSFNDVQFPGSASNGTVTASTITPKDATAAGTVNAWRLKDNGGVVIASGVAGQRYQIAALNRATSTIEVTGDVTAQFPARSSLTLHNKNDTAQNVYILVDDDPPTYDAVSNRTSIPVHPDLNAPPYSTLTWTHVHPGELGLDNSNIQVDQRVTVDSFKITVP